MHKNATKCNETLSKWCKNKHGASKIIDTFETYHSPAAQADLTFSSKRRPIHSLTPSAAAHAPCVVAAPFPVSLTPGHIATMPTCPQPVPCDIRVVPSSYHAAPSRCLASRCDGDVANPLSKRTAMCWFADSHIAATCMR
jgi:hypothetical protein